MSVPVRRVAAGAVVLGAVLLAAIASLDVHRRRTRRAERTAEATLQSRSPTPLQSALMGQGCTSVLVLPLIDFEQEDFTSFSSRPSSEVTLIWCVVPAGMSGDLCSSAHDVLRSRSDRPPGEFLIVVADSAGWKCQQQYDAKGGMSADVRSGGVILHRPQRRGALDWVKSFSGAMHRKLCRALDC